MARLSEEVETHCSPLDWAGKCGDEELTPTIVHEKAANTSNSDNEKLDAALYSGLIEVLKSDTEPRGVH